MSPMREGTTADESGQPMSWRLRIYGGVLAEFRHNEETRGKPIDVSGLASQKPRKAQEPEAADTAEGGSEMQRLVRPYTEKLVP